MAEEHRFTVRGAAYWVMFAVIVGSIIYTTNASTNRQISASEARQIDRSTQQLACLSTTFEDFLSGNQKLRDANARWQTALLESKKANRQLIILRDIRGLPRESPEVQQAAQAYVDQTRDFIEASDDLAHARRTYTLPKFEDECGKLQPEFKGAWLAQAEGFGDVQPYATGLTIEPQ